MKEINSYGSNMADDTRKVRVEERLKIKIAEAKNLPARGHGAASHRDTYCVLSLDQEEIFRTSIMEKTLNPFFGEEFQFEVPRRFRYLSIYVFDRDKHDKVLGKVAIKREDLQSYNNKDHWFAFRPVDADSEVQGKAHIEILFEDTKNLDREEEDPESPDSNCDYQETRITEAIEDVQYSHQNLGSKQDLGLGEDYNTSDRKFKVKKISKNITEYCKESIKFGSCSSSTSKKFLTGAGLSESNVVLSRSESLKNQFPNYQNLSHQVVGLKGKYNVHTIQGGFKDADVSNIMGSTESNHYSSDPERHYINIDSSGKVRKEKVELDLRNKVAIRVLECSELTTKSGQCDPYAAVSVEYANGRKIEKRTKVRKKTINPVFDEFFVFDLMLEGDGKEKEKDGNNAYTVSAYGASEAVAAVVTLYHEGTVPAFLGEVRVRLGLGPRQRALINNDAWYFLRSRSIQEASRGATPPGTRLSAAGSASALGSLRLLLQYTVDRVFPLRDYQQLDALLVRSVNVRPITASAVYILGEVVSNKTDAAQPLVRLFTHHDLIVPLVKALAEAEISTLTDVTTIFRGNTLVSKMMDEAMRLSGAGYLRAVLRPTLAAVLAEKRPCEIDPTRCKDKQAVEAHRANLKEYVEKVFTAITESYGACPAAMCQLFDALRQCASRHFPRNAEVRYSVVSGFIFLRFFAPAILGPRLFELTTEHIDPQTHRTLTLISKTIQSLGNLVSSRSAQQVCKEEYMAELYKSFCTDRHVQAVRQFLEIISTGSDSHNNNIQETPVLKEGMMIKRSEPTTSGGGGGGGGASRRRWARMAGGGGQRRHFRLTSGELSWSKARGKPPSRRLALGDVTAVAPVDTPPGAHPLGTANMFQIVLPERTLFVQAGNCVERAEWLRLLAALCRRRHHTGEYQDGKWTCCEARCSTAAGCASASGSCGGTRAACPALALRLDPARDLQRLHCLLYTHAPTLERHLAHLTANICTPAAASSPTFASGTGNIDNKPMTAEELAAEVKTLKELQLVIYNLEHQHRVYQRSLARETKYGSKQAPIGDDNYLHLAATANMDGHQISSYRQFKGTLMAQSPTTVPRDTSLSPMYLQPRSLPVISQHAPPDYKNSPLNLTTSSVDSNETYLKNSLYIGSSTESLKNSERNAEERLSGKSEKSLTVPVTITGYTKMSCTASDLESRPNCPPRTLNLHTSPLKNLTVPQPGKILYEYVDIKPKLPERQPKGKVTGKRSTEISLEEQANDPSYYCKEYELMSNFMSCAAKQRLQIESGDSPPVVPPRSHHLNGMSVSGKLVNSQKTRSIGSDTKSPQNKMAALREYKSMEHYQLKSLEQTGEKEKLEIRETDGEQVEKRLSGNTDEEIYTTKMDSKKFDAQFEKSYTNSTPKDAYCVLKVEEGVPIDKDSSGDCDTETPKEENIDSELNTQKEGVVPESVVKKEDHGFFSRKSAQRKSNPTKSHQPTSSLKKLKASSSTSNVREAVSSQSKSTFIAEKLTPFFMRCKPKPALDQKEEITQNPTKKEDNLFGRLTPRFGQSRLHSLDLKSVDDKSLKSIGLERSATTSNVSGRHLNSSIVGNLKFLSLHRHGAEETVKCQKFVRNTDPVCNRQVLCETVAETKDCVAESRTQSDLVDSIRLLNICEGTSLRRADNNDNLELKSSSVVNKSAVSAENSDVIGDKLERVYENEINFDKVSENIVILRDKHRTDGNRYGTRSLEKNVTSRQTDYVDKNLNIATTSKSMVASTNDIRL